MGRWATYDRTTPEAKARRAKYASLEHRTARANWTAIVEAGAAHCWRCGIQLVPGRWVVGHDDHDTDAIRGPECTPCNNRAGARKGNRIAAARGNPVAARVARVAWAPRRW